MRRQDRAQKSLLNMPADVMASAYLGSDSFFGHCLLLLEMMLHLLVWLLRLPLWLLSVGTILVALYGMSTKAEYFPKELWVTPAGLAVALVVVASLLYVMVLRRVPRKGGSDYPLVSDLGEWRMTALRFSLHASSCAVALCVLAYFSPPGAPFRSALGWALATVAVAAATITLWWKQPTGGRRVPSEEERQAFFERERSKQAVTPAAAQDADYATPVGLEQPRSNFQSIHGMHETKAKLLAAATEVLRSTEESAESPRNGILLHGKPGNGKTVFAEALAGELEVPLIRLTYNVVASKWIGETPRLLSRSFAYAKEQAPCVLFIDEVDSLLRSRDGAGHAEDWKAVNTLLTEIVDLRAHQVVLVASTNYLDRLDAAAIREGRFDFKVEVPAPDLDARLGLLRTAFHKHTQGLRLDEGVLQAVAERWNGLSVSRLMAVAKALPDVVPKGRRAVGFAEWVAALQSVQGAQGRVPEGAKRLSELILPEETRQPLASLSQRLRNSYETERLGGTVPRGVLFHGAPGTGKTATAKALAIQCNWTYLEASGPDLLADRVLLATKFEQANDLRPAILFIDEADDLLRERSQNPQPAATNQLLVLMDGGGDAVKDVVVVAATNHIESIDPALLRSGRFTEKIHFALPGEGELTEFVVGWLSRRPYEIRWEPTTKDLAAALLGLSIADAEGVLQYALNRAISRHDPGNARGPVKVLEGDVAEALRVVCEGRVI